MKEFSQCLMCCFQNGRSCLKTKSVIEDDIYKNQAKCANFKSLEEETFDVDIACCVKETLKQ